jgi:hypothetical protein
MNHAGWQAAEKLAEQEAQPSPVEACHESESHSMPCRSGMGLEVEKGRGEGLRESRLISSVDGVHSHTPFSGTVTLTRVLV